jgi:hypothetical protein
MVQPVKISDGSALNRCVTFTTRLREKLRSTHLITITGLIFVFLPRPLLPQSAVTIVNGAHLHGVDHR